MRSSKIFNLLYMFITLSISMCALTSCDNHEELPVTSTTDFFKVENCATVKELQEFNNNFVPSQETRGWEFTLAEVLAVGLSDFSGACVGAKLGGAIGGLAGPKGAIVGGTIGGVICGAAQSLAAYKMAESIKNFSPYSTSGFKNFNQKSYEVSYVLGNDLITKQDYQLGISLGLDSCSVKIGILHNKTLDVIESINVEGNQDSYISNLDSIQKTVINDIDFINEFKKVSFNPPFKADPNSAMDTVMSLFIDAIKNNVKSPKDLDIIIKYYCFIVNNYSSDLTQIEKEALLAGFSVMKYSVSYWASKPIFQSNDI